MFFQHGRDVPAAESVAGVEHDGERSLDRDFAGDGLHVAVDHVVILRHLTLACGESVVLNDLEQVLNLIARERQPAIGHLDTVVLRVEMAPGDHHTGTVIAITGRGEVDSRCEHFADVGHVHTGGCEPLDDGRFEGGRRETVVATDEDTVGAERAGQVGSQRPADQPGNCRRELPVLSRCNTANVIFTENGCLNVCHRFSFDCSVISRLFCVGARHRGEQCSGKACGKRLAWPARVRRC